jgi:threonine/homoserine efflux transporter RhtA
MTVAEPVVASVLGVLVLGEALRPGDDGWVLLFVAVVVMIVATVALARSQAAADSPSGTARPASVGG